MIVNRVACVVGLLFLVCCIQSGESRALRKARNSVLALVDDNVYLTEDVDGSVAQGRWKRLASSEEDTTYKVQDTAELSEEADTASVVLWVVIGVCSVIIVLLCCCLVALLRMVSQINVYH